MTSEYTVNHFEDKLNKASSNLANWQSDYTNYFRKRDQIQQSIDDNEPTQEVLDYMNIDISMFRFYKQLLDIRSTLRKDWY